MRLARLFTIAVVAVAAALLAAPSAHAVTFTFAEPSADVPTAFTPCFTSNNDRCGTTLRFVVDSLGVTVSSDGIPGDGEANAVVQDRDPEQGGLGVVYQTQAGGFTVGEGEDEINDFETLILTFDIPVILSTLTFFDDDHLGMADPDGIDPLDTFELKVDAGLFIPYAFGHDFSGIQGTSFSFRMAGPGDDDFEDFYLGGMEASPVPEPTTLLLLGSGLTGLVMRRRRRRM